MRVVFEMLQTRYSPGESATPEQIAKVKDAALPPSSCCAPAVVRWEHEITHRLTTSKCRAAHYHHSRLRTRNGNRISSWSRRPYLENECRRGSGGNRPARHVEQSVEEILAMGKQHDLRRFAKLDRRHPALEYW